MTRAGRAATVAVVAFTVAGVADHFIAGRGFLPSDALDVLDGAAVLDRCLDQRDLTGCEPATGEEVGPFPLIQYAIALAGKWVGASYDQAARALLAVSGLALIAMLALLVPLRRRLLDRSQTALLALVLVTGPLLWYAESGFGESLAAFLALGTIASLALGAPAPAIFTAALLAGITKETAPVFVVAIAAVVLFALRRPLARGLLPVAAGAAVATVANALFNVWRYGAVYNDYYAEPARMAPGPGARLEYFAGQIAAPNAGLVFYWPVATAALVLVFAAARRGDERSRRAAFALALTLAALLALFASYHSPYGWDAWAPRYLVPWIPALCLAGLIAAGPRMAEALRPLTRRPLRIATLAAVIAVAAAPQVGAFVRPFVAFELFADRSRPCVYIGQGVIAAYEHREHRACHTERAWKRPPILLETAARVGTSSGLLFMALVAACAAAATAALAPPRRDEPFS